MKIVLCRGKAGKISDRMKITKKPRFISCFNEKNNILNFNAFAAVFYSKGHLNLCYPIFTKIFYRFLTVIPKS